MHEHRVAHGAKYLLLFEDSSKEHFIGTLSQSGNFLITRGISRAT